MALRASGILYGIRGRLLMWRVRFCVAGMLSLLALAVPAVAAEPKTLPQGWSIPDDATYAPADKRPRYRPSGPRRGIYAHGESGAIEAVPGFDDDAAREACYRRTGAFPDRPKAEAEEYWYFEASGEALLLLKKNAIAGYDDQCRVMVRSTASVERAIIGPDSFTRFVDTGDGWHGETQQFVEYRRLSDLDEIALGDYRPPLARFAVRKRRLEDFNGVARIGKVATNCLTYSSPPDAGAGQCWIASPNLGKGIVTFDTRIDMGSQSVYQNVDEYQDGIPIDGRLFEWDRAIRYQGSEVTAAR